MRPAAIAPSLPYLPGCLCESLQRGALGSRKADYRTDDISTCLQEQAL